MAQHALVAVLMLISLMQAIAMLRGGAVLGNDFKHEWAGSWLLMHGFSPYDAANLFRVRDSQQWKSINPFVYLPTTGLFLRPIADLPYATASVVWFALNWLLAWIIVLAAPAALRVARSGIARVAGAAFLAGSLPFYRQMSAGQMNVVTAGLILIAAAALLRRREVWAGVVLGLGFAWKIAPALLIAAFLPLRRWRAFAVGCAVSAALLGVSFALYGVEINRQALDVIREMRYGHSTWSGQNDFYRAPYNQSPNALMHHLFTENPYTEPWLMLGNKAANGLTILATLIIIAAWALAFLIVRRRISMASDSAPCLPLFLAATLVMLLLPSLCWDHYAVQALPALIWIFGQERTLRSPWRAGGATLILILLSVPLKHNDPAYSSGPGILLMSLRLWPLLALYAWLLAESVSRAREKTELVG